MLSLISRITQAPSALPRTGSDFSTKLVCLLLLSWFLINALVCFRTGWHCLTVDPRTLLKGKLKDSPTITAGFSAATIHFQKSDDLSRWITGMFDVKQTSGSWDGWEPDMSYCQPCLTKFLEDHVWVWYLNECAQSMCILLALSLPPHNSCFPQRDPCRRRTAGASHTTHIRD
jgi:hypothetical protein